MSTNNFNTFIREFLDKNYEVKTTDIHFSINDKISNIDSKTYSFSQFTEVFIKLFGEFSIDVLDEWFNFHRDFLVQDLNEFMCSLENTDGSLVMLNKVISHFQRENGISKYHDAFIISVFNDFYKHTFTIPTLQEIKETFDNGQTSVELLNELGRRLEFETATIQEYAMNNVNKWYSDTHLGKKLDDLFKEFVVTLGPRNWIVTWIGHGVVTNHKLITEFMNETPFQHQLILNKFDHWYTEAVQEASERYMSRGSGLII